MSFRKVLLVGFNGNELKEKYWERMDQLCKERVFTLNDSPELQSHLVDTDCLLVKLGAKVPRDLIARAPILRYIGILGTGYGGIDDEYAAEKGIAVCNIAGYSTEAVAELTFGLLLEHFRDLERAKIQTRESNYSEATFFSTREIKGKRFGVIGLGNIGSRVAELAVAFGAKATYWSRTRKGKYEDMGVAYRSLDELLSTSDIISLNLALNSDTENFLNKARIANIKQGAIVINLSPMELVDLDALVVRLKEESLTFILDHSDEMSPAQLEKIKSYSNCVIYPPIGYTTQEATALKQEIFVENMANYIAGTPTNKVN